jgi:chitodextrinase
MMKNTSLVLCLAICVWGVPGTVWAQSTTSPELPRVLLDTTYPSTTGATRTVPAGGDLQATLASANPGDTIVLQAGATFTGNFVLPAKAGASYIVIRTSALDAGFPAEGTRVGPAEAPMMARIVTPNSSPAISTAPGAHHYRLVGLEIGVASGVAINYGLVALGDGSSAQNQLTQVPHDLVVDRCYIHGNATGNTRRGVALNSASSAVIDSTISECHEVGADSQAICGWNGPGPYKIVNNRLEGAGENVLIGGADPAIPNLVPSDLEIRRNSMVKPLRWKVGHATHDGSNWSVKNIFELKNAQRVLVEGNTFENNWVNAQNGFSILFTPRNQDGTAPWSVVRDVTFRHNTVRHVAAGVNILGRDNYQPSQQTTRIAVVNNLFEDVDGAAWGNGPGRLFQIVYGADAITIDHNTAFQSGPVIFADGDASTRVTFTNNIVPHSDYGIIGSGTGSGTNTIVTYFPTGVFANNAFVTPYDYLAGRYPVGNFFPADMAAVGFVNAAAGDYHLAASSPYLTAATDGTALGADVDAIAAAASGSGGSGGDGDPGPEPDTTAPAIGTPMVDELTTASATVHWSTDEPADGQVEYGTSMALGSATALDASAATSHAAALSGLQPDTNYYFRVRSRDAAGNLAVSDIAIFSTMAVPPPPPPPPAGTLQSVQWSHLVRCTVQGTSLRKTAGRSGKPDATAASAQRIVSGTAYLEFTATNNSTDRWVGLGRDAAGVDPSGIDFCIRLAARGKASIAERGSRVRNFTYSAGDVFRISVENGVVTYSRNGVVFHTSLLAPVYPLYANAALVTLNGTIDGAVVYGVFE